MDLITEMGVAHTFSVKAPTQENYFLERFHQKLMEVVLEIGLMSDIFMNWRRAKSDIFYFSSCKSMKKMHLFFLHFSNDLSVASTETKKLDVLIYQL